MATMSVLNKQLIGHGGEILTSLIRFSTTSRAWLYIRVRGDINRHLNETYFVNEM